MKPLADWSPIALKGLYENEVYKLAHNEFTDEQRDNQNKKTEALYRLGTHPDMKEVWEKLLAKEAIAIKYPIDKELALVGGIHGHIWSNHFGAEQATPEMKTKELKKIVKRIEDLKEDIQNSGHGSYWNQNLMQAYLHKRNIDYRNQHGESIGSQSPTFLEHIYINANAELSQIPLDEHMPWKDRYSQQRLGWWTREALSLNLTDILDFYSELMMDSSEVYKEFYQRDKPKLIRGLQDLMNSLYGSPLDAYVADLVRVIFEDYYIDRDNVKSYR